MALADLLGALDGNLLGLPQRPAYGGYQFDIPQAAPQAQPQMAQAMPAAHTPSKFRNFLGAIGDALLVGGGGQPLYRQRMEEQRQQTALQGFLTNPDQAIAQLMQVDAPSAIKLYQSIHSKQNLPDTAQLYEYRQKLGPAERADFDNVMTKLHPGLLAPISLGPNDTYDAGTGSGSTAGALPHVTDQATYDAVPPGAKYTTPDGHTRQKPGGQTASPSGGFSVSKVLDALTAQESHGDGKAVGPMTKYGRAYGSTQLQSGTAKQMAGKLGLAFRPDMLLSTDPAALKYQRTLAEAYLREGLDQTGNLTDALHYYHGGPDRSLWGPKTRAYANSILSRLQ